MDMRLVDRICEHMEDKKTDELFKIYIEHNTEKWSKEAFEAIKLILKKRGESIPRITGEKPDKIPAGGSGETPGMEAVDLGEVVKGIERSGRGWCLKVFLLLIGIILILGVIRIGIFAPSSIGRAYGFLNVGDPVEALEEFKNVIRMEPDNKKAHFGMGLCYVGMRKYDRATECFDSLIEKFPKDLDIYFRIVFVVNHIMERYNTTIDFLKRAQDVKPGNKKEALFFERKYQENLGWAYYKSGKHAKAVECFKRARHLWDINLEPDLNQTGMAETYLYYGVYYKLIGEEKMAVDCFKKSITYAINPIIGKKSKTELQEIKEGKSRVLKI